MNEGYDRYVVGFNTIDQSIAADEELAVYRVAELGDKPAAVGQVRERSSRLEGTLDELAGCGW
jgi:hypothetical protein